MKCKFPDCFHCDLPDCTKDKLNTNLEKARIYNQNYKNRVRASLIKCNECKQMMKVNASNLNGFVRICLKENRVIGKNISSCPMWCSKREDDVFKRAHERRVEREREKAM